MALLHQYCQLRSWLKLKEQCKRARMPWLHDKSVGFFLFPSNCGIISNTLCPFKWQLVFSLWAALYCCPLATLSASPCLCTHVKQQRSLAPRKQKVLAADKYRLGVDTDQQISDLMGHFSYALLQELSSSSCLWSTPVWVHPPPSGHNHIRPWGLCCLNPKNTILALKKGIFLAWF